MDNKKEISLGRFTFKIDDVNKLLGFGVSQIYSEREKQIKKHGFDAENQAKNPQYCGSGQLQYAAHTLLDLEVMGNVELIEPLNWDRERFIRLCEKPQEDRIRIAAALLAAELDRLEYLRNH